MKDLINLYHKNHSLIYKLFLFIITTFVIVYLFPKSGTFRYSFEKGKPWQSENLYAPFDFAIKKSSDEIFFPLVASAVNFGHFFPNIFFVIFLP